MIGLRRSGKCLQTMVACANFCFGLQALFFPCADVLSSCRDFFGSHAPRFFPSSLSLPSEERDGGGRSRDALVLLPEGLPLLPLDFGPARVVEEPLVARSVHASSLLSPRFIRGLGIQELLSCGGLLLPDLSQLVLPPHLCSLCEVVRRESLPSAAPVRVPPWLPDLRLGKPGRCFEPALGWVALVIGLVAHAFRVRFSGRDVVGVDRLVYYFPLSGR